MLFRRTRHLPDNIHSKNVDTKVVSAEGENLPWRHTCVPGGDLSMFLNSFKRSVINQIIASDDNRIVQDSLEHYFRAFTGAFESNMPFTFYFEAQNKPLMLVYDATPIPARSSHTAFIEHCDRIKAKILPITDFAQELAGAGYVKEIPLDFKDRPSLPLDYENYWRKYRHFYSDVMNGLSFVCFTRLVPTQKLYDVWVKFNSKALAG
jgi:hypothetical protein